MKRSNSLPIIISILTFSSILITFLVLQPAAFPIFNLSNNNTANIGTTLGGIISPIVSMYSVYLLYEALTAQLKNNKDQRLKSNSDILFILLNQLDKEYDSFFLEQTKGGEEFILKGYEALAQICYLAEKNASIEFYAIFKNSVDANKIMYLVRSFMLIVERVKHSDFEPDTREIFEKKLLYYYRAKFKFPVLFLTRGFIEFNDDFINEIRIFQSTNDLIQ